jgi:hypothetical protein
MIDKISYLCQFSCKILLFMIYVEHEKNLQSVKEERSLEPKTIMQMCDVWINKSVTVEPDKFTFNTVHTKITSTQGQSIIIQWIKRVETKHTNQRNGEECLHTQHFLQHGFLINLREVSGLDFRTNAHKLLSEGIFGGCVEHLGLNLCNIWSPVIFFKR